MASIEDIKIFLMIQSLPQNHISENYCTGDKASHTWAFGKHRIYKLQHDYWLTDMENA